MLERISNDDPFCLEGQDFNGFKSMLKTPINWKKVEFLDANELRLVYKILCKREYSDELLQGVSLALKNNPEGKPDENFLNILNNIIVSITNKKLELNNIYDFYIKNNSQEVLINDIIKNKTLVINDVQIKASRGVLNSKILINLLTKGDGLYNFLINSSKDVIQDFTRKSGMFELTLYEKVIQDLSAKDSNKGIILFNSLMSKNVGDLKGFSISMLNNVIELMVNYPEMNREHIKKGELLNYFSSINENNYVKKIKTINSFNLDIWSDGGFLIKSLYGQGKKDLVLKLVNEYKIDLENYEIFYNDMQKRSMRKDLSKADDFNHLVENVNPIVESIKMKIDLEKELSKKENNINKKIVKF